MQTKIGLVGCGEWGKLILRDLKTLGCHVSVVSTLEKSTQYAQAGFADVIVNSISELKDIDGFVIASPTSTHAAVIDELAKANPYAPIFVEKPMTANLSDAENLVQKYASRLFVMHKWRYHSGILALADLLAKQRLGKLLGMRLTRVDTVNNHPDVDIIWTCLPHDLSIVIAILGYIPELQSATAIQWGAETMALSGLWGQEPWVSIDVSTIRQMKQREVRLECEHGVAVLNDGYAEHIEIYHRKEMTNQLSTQPELLSIALEMPLLNELRAFVSYLNGGVKPLSDAHEGLEVVRAITQVRTLAGITQTGIL